MGAFWLEGNYAPVTEEHDAVDLPVLGALPPQLRGRYIRNGPNPTSGESPHWFLGDGMLHGVELSGGKATAYRNRWVQTRSRTEAAELISPEGVVDHTVGVSNTNIVRHAGRYLALVETSFPCEVTPDLTTVGPYDFGGRLRSAMTAHPKECPTTGELHFFGYGFFPPYLTYHRVSAAGELVQTEEIPVPGPTMIHDFNLTAGHVVFMDLPIVFDLEMAMTGDFPYRWDDGYGARLGVLPRGKGADALRWFDIEPCYVFHPLNAWDDGDQVVIDVARYPHMWRTGWPGTPPATLHRWTIDLAASTVSETALDDRPIEFPRVDDRRVSLPHRYGYAVHSTLVGNTETAAEKGNVIVRYDRESGVTDTFAHGPGRVGDESVFAPASASAAEDEGWLLSYVYDVARGASDLVVVDAHDLVETARVQLPCRVPFGFHGNWFPDEG